MSPPRPRSPTCSRHDHVHTGVAPLPSPLVSTPVSYRMHNWCRFRCKPAINTPPPPARPRRCSGRAAAGGRDRSASESRYSPRDSLPCTRHGLRWSGSVGTHAKQRIAQALHNTSQPPARRGRRSSSCPRAAAAATPALADNAAVSSATNARVVIFSFRLLAIPIQAHLPTSSPANDACGPVGFLNKSAAALFLHRPRAGLAILRGGNQPVS